MADSSATPQSEGGNDGKKKEPRVGRAYGTPEAPCARCRTAGVPCTFESKPVKRGPPRGYVESLERRLEAMEGLLAALSPAAAGMDEQSSRVPSLAGEREEELLRRSTTGSASPSEHSFSSAGPYSPVDTLTGEMEELSVDKDRYVGRGSGLHLAHSIRQFSKPTNDTQPSLPEDDISPSIVEHLLMEDHRFRSHGFQLPPPDLSAKLVAAFFDKFNSMVMLLHRPSFERTMADGSLDRDASFRSLYFMVCAIGARFVDDSRLDIAYAPNDPVGSRQSRGFDYFKASSGSASPTLMSATLYDIQSSVLVIVWLLGAATPISAWAAVGFAIRRVVDVGAHREVRSRWNNSPLEDQLRRRAFGWLLGFDSMLSSGLGRPLAIHEEDTDMADPMDIDDATLDLWNLRGPTWRPEPSKEPGPISSFSCHRKLMAITSRALRLLYGMNRQSTSQQQASDAVTELDSLLNNWLNAVPEHLKWNPEKQDPKHLAHSIGLYTSYYNTQILVHRDFITPSRSHLHPFPSLAICSNAARSCSHVLDLAARRGLLDAAFWNVPLTAATSGLVLLINVFAKSSPVTSLSSSAMSDVKKCIAVLDALKSTTHLALKCSVGLTQLAALAAAAPVPSLKRSIDSQHPSPAVSSDSPSVGDSPSSTADQDGTEYVKKRRVEHLPMTTNDLSLGTFNGRPTFSITSARTNVAKSAAFSSAPPPSSGLSSFQTPLLPVSFSSHNQNLGVGDPHSAALLDTLARLNASSAPPVVDSHTWASHYVPQSTPSMPLPNPGPYSGAQYDVPTSVGFDINSLPSAAAYNQYSALPLSGATEAAPSNPYDFDWSSWGVANDSNIDFEALLPALTGSQNMPSMG